MVSIPLYLFLFIYFAFLILVAVFLLVDLLHIFQTGTLSFISFLATLLALGAFIAVLFATWYFLQGVDWRQGLVIWDNEWLRNVLRLPSQL